MAQRTIRNAIAKSLDNGITLIEEFLPIEIRKKFNLVELKTAIKDMHLPKNVDSFHNARRRLSFDELFLNQLNVLCHFENHRLLSAFHKLFGCLVCLGILIFHTKRLGNLQSSRR